jgi:aminoglycoside 3-N-acetyltransferase
MKSFLKKILPSFILDLYRREKSKERLKEIEKAREEGNVHSKNSIAGFLKASGIKEGDVVMLHSSLTSLGFVEGGAPAVIDAFLSSIGNSGTLMMPSFPASGFNFDHLSEEKVFDARNTPSKTGIISETFRKMTGVKRSLHPTDPVVAFGPKAEYLTGEHFGQLTPYSEKSPFLKLCELNGKIILMGVDLNSLTNLHTLEDAVTDFKFPVYHSKIFDCELVDEDGAKKAMRTKVHDPAWSRKRKCNELIPVFTKDGCLKELRMGRTGVYLIDAKGMHESMLKNYSEKGITMYTPQGS